MMFAILLVVLPAVLGCQECPPMCPTESPKFCFAGHPPGIVCPPAPVCAVAAADCPPMPALPPAVPFPTCPPATPMACPPHMCPPLAICVAADHDCPPPPPPPCGPAPTCPTETPMFCHFPPAVPVSPPLTCAVAVADCPC